MWWKFNELDDRWFCFYSNVGFGCRIEKTGYAYLLPFGNSIVFLTFIVHIPDDHFCIQFAKIACQMRSNATTTSSNQHHLPGNILQNYKKRLKLNKWKKILLKQLKQREKITNNCV